MQNLVVYCACGYAVILVTAWFRFIVKCTCACEDCQNSVRAYFFGRITIYYFHLSGCHWDPTSPNYHLI